MVYIKYNSINFPATIIFLRALLFMEPECNRQNSVNRKSDLMPPRIPILSMASWSLSSNLFRSTSTAFYLIALLFKLFHTYRYPLQ